MWTQTINPLDNLLLSSLVGFTPIITLIIALILFRLPGHKAAFITSIVTFFIAVFVWKMPAQMALASYLFGVLFGLWPIAWILVNALTLFNLAEKTGSLKDLTEWMVNSLPRDHGVQSIFIAYLFGNLIEGVDGFGFPIAISAAILTRLGLSPLMAVMVSLLANTIIVPFASLGIPLITLGLVTGLDLYKITLLVSLQLIVFAIIIPFLMAYFIGGKRLSRFFDVILVSGLSLGLLTYLASIATGPYLVGIIAPIGSMIIVLLYLRLRYGVLERVSWRVFIRGWIPWIYVVLFMTVFTVLDLTRLVSFDLPIPYLHNMVYVELYDSVYSAVYKWQPLAHGTLVLFASIATIITFRISFRVFAKTFAETTIRLRNAILTILQVVGIAYLMNYSGISFTLGYSLASAKTLFPILSAFIGWIGTFISGSSTGSNALFGNLQRVGAETIGISPYITTATNATGGVLGKIVSLQSIVVGTSAVGITGKEGEIMKKLIPYSLLLTTILATITLIQTIH